MSIAVLKPARETKFLLVRLCGVAANATYAPAPPEGIISKGETVVEDEVIASTGTPETLLTLALAGDVPSKTILSST